MADHLHLVPRVAARRRVAVALPHVHVADRDTVPPRPVADQLSGLYRLRAAGVHHQPDVLVQDRRRHEPQLLSRWISAYPGSSVGTGSPSRIARTVPTVACSAARNSSEPVLTRRTPRSASSPRLWRPGRYNTLSGAGMASTSVRISASSSGPGTKMPSAPTAR